MRDKETGLTHKELSLADEYLNNGFNELKAYESSEYSQNCTIVCKRANTTKILKKPHIAAYIQTKIAEKKASSIASRKDRQRFWTKVVNGALEGIKITMGDRLKASELLGRSEADFTDNINQTDTQRQRELDEKQKVEAGEIAKIRLREFKAG